MSTPATPPLQGLFGFFKGKSAPKAAIAEPAAAVTWAPDAVLLGATKGTAEEESLREAGLLPANYLALKAAAARGGEPAAKVLATAGQAGPFSPSVGDPATILDLARKMNQDPELARLYRDLRPGDIVIIENPRSLVRVVTSSAATHVMVCTSGAESPHGVGFIEALEGIGGVDDAGVRRATLADQCGKDFCFRILRPAASMDKKTAQQAVSKAIAHAEKQLGKPYDYAFSNDPSRAYCSRLAYDAYVKGAGVPLPLTPSTQSQKQARALMDVFDALEPTNKTKLVAQAYLQLLGPGAKPDAEKIVGFTVNEVLPNCKTTQGIARTPEDRAKLEKMLNKVIAGEAFPTLTASLAPAASIMPAGAICLVTGALVADTRALVQSSGIDGTAAAAAATKLVYATVPHLDTLVGMAYGPDDLRTHAAVALLDRLDELAVQNPHLARSLPTRPTTKTEHSLITPGELAGVAVPSYDYNAKKKPAFKFSDLLKLN